MSNTFEADTFVFEQHHWHGRTLGLKTVEALMKNYFDAVFCETREEATLAALQFIKPGMKIGFGGSQTARQLNLQAKAETAGAIILDHNDARLSEEEKMEMRRQQQICDVFISSSNAISLQGELYNVDGHGNRVSAITFGPKKIIIVAGVNKLCADEEAAWQRIKTIAAPVNFKRLNRPNPCTKTGICMDCNLPTRGCNIYHVLRRRPPHTDITVILVNESLGF